MPVTQLDRDAQRCPCQRMAYRHQHKRSSTLQCTNAGCTTHDIHMGANLYHCRDRSCFHRFCHKCHSASPRVALSEYEAMCADFEPVLHAGQGQFSYKFVDPTLLNKRVPDLGLNPAERTCQTAIPSLIPSDPSALAAQIEAGELVDHLNAPRQAPCCHRSRYIRLASIRSGGSVCHSVCCSNLAHGAKL